MTMEPPISMVYQAAAMEKERKCDTGCSCEGTATVQRNASSSINFHNHDPRPHSIMMLYTSIKSYQHLELKLDEAY